jgi:3-oxoacyl-[acyl-carrier protein] reductase
MQIDLTGKTALVTGGSRGIGRACCLALAVAGARVIINYHQSKDKAEALKEAIARSGVEAAIFQANLAVPEEVAALFRYVKETFSSLDILVNNAGVIKDNLLLTMPLADWNKVQDLDLRGAFLATQYAVEMMLPRHAGKIINIASISAIRGGRGQTNYAAAKGGLVAFSRACAIELAAKGIQVNAVLPGMIVTDMSSRIRKRAGEALVQSIPAERLGEPADVAHLVVFLASTQADYLTGQAIAVDGGMSAA